LPLMFDIKSSGKNGSTSLSREARNRVPNLPLSHHANISNPRLVDFQFASRQKRNQKSFRE
jgi:hypothetical protein